VLLADVQNETSEPDAGLLAAREAERALARCGAARGAGGPLEISGAVERLSFVPSAAGPQRVAVWHAEARLRLTLSDPGAAGRVLARAVVSGTEDFLPGAADPATGRERLEATEVSRRIAVERLLRRLASEALDRLAP